jgi:hypothetical protein
LDEPGIDGRGLIVTGKHLIQLGPISSDHRLKAHQIYNEPILGYTPIPSVETFVKNYTTKVTFFQEMYSFKLVYCLDGRFNQ